MIGLVIGGALSFYMFAGAPRASQLPGIPIQPPDGIVPAGTAQIVLRQEFLNEILAAIFRDMNAPAFQLASGGNGVNVDTNGFKYAAFQESPPCDGKITLLREGSGVQTGLRFDNNRISAPLAFSGSYNSVVGCLRFTGWAQANFELRYDNAQQAVFGRINVETVNLDGVNPILNSFVTPLVQSTLNNRVNPIRILDGKQIGLQLPIASTGGSLRGNVQDVRADLKDNSLNLYVIYAFSGGPIQ